MVVRKTRNVKRAIKVSHLCNLTIDRFLRDITVAMLINQNTRLSLLWELNFILMQVLRKHFILFGPPLWPSCFVSENHLIPRLRVQPYFQEF